MKNKEQFQKMLDALPCGVGIYEEAPQLKELYLNDAFFKMIGYTRSEYALMKSHPAESYLAPEDRSVYAENAQKMQAQGYVSDCEYRVVRRDQTLRWVQLNVSRILLEGETVYFASFTDITRAKESEIASTDAEDRFRLVLESTNTAVFEWSSRTGNYYSSELFHSYALSSLHAENAFKKAAYNAAVHPEDLSVFSGFFEEIASRKEKTECVLRLKMTDGSYRWCRLVCILLSKGRKDEFRVVGAILDINDEMEKAAIHQELLKALPGGIAVFKIADKPACLYYNDALTLWAQRPHGDLSRAIERADIASVVFPADKALFDREVTQKARLGLPINATFRCVLSRRETQNRFEWIHLSATKIREDDGFPIYYAVMTIPPQESTLYRSIIEDSLTSAIVIESGTGVILFTNQAFRAMFSQNGDTALAGKAMREALSPEVAQKLTEQIPLLTQQGMQENDLQTKEGKCLFIKGKKLLWNGVDACLFYMQDQTALKKRNDELMRLLDDVPGGIGINEIVSGHMTQLYLNEGFFHMIGATRAAMRDFTEEKHLALIHPDDVRLFAEGVGRLNHGEKHIDVTYRMKNAQQKYVWLRMIGKELRQEDGRVFVYCSYFDVDEQTKNQLSLDKERAILQIAMQAAKISSWEYDLQTRCIHQDTSAQFQHGYGAVVENVPESVIADGFVHPDSAEVYRRLFLPMKKAGDVTKCDIRVRLADREGWWWARVIVLPIFDRNGKHVSSIGVTIDITEQKSIEAKYEHQVEAFNSANASNLIAKGLYNLTENNAEYYCGETSDAVKLDKKHTYDNALLSTATRCAVPEEKREFLRRFDRQEMLRQFKLGNPETSFEYQRSVENGGILWVQTVGKLYAGSDSEDVMCFIYSYNINEQRTAREMIDTVVKADYDYLALLDCRTGDYQVFANQAGTRTPLPPFHSSDYGHEVAEYAKAYLLPEDIERNIRDMSVENIKKQLKDQNMFAAYAAIRESDGRISRKKLQFSYLDRTQGKVLITRVDVTDVYEREQEQYKKLQAANRAKNDFLSHMSHDLRTPMNAIIGLSELAQSELHDAEAMKTYVGNIQSAGQFLLGLVNDCLDFEKLTSHKMKLKPVPYPYQEFRNSILLMIEPLCKQKRIDFSFSESAPYTVCIDKVRFEQIFFNLLSNSVKYTPDGGRIEFIADSHLSGDEKLVICDFFVRDNGIGMSEEFQKRLFEPFEQENESEHSAQQGTGLGLSIVKELVDLMGGAIKITSRQGEGTEVKVHLDMPNITGQESGPSEGQAAAPQMPLTGKTVLLLEDQPLNMLIAKKLLEKQGVNVVCGEDGRKGLDLFQSAAPGAFDAILTDIRMPVMNGLELARAVRALPREDARSIPIVAMTANAFEEDVQASQQAGMNAHLSKPIEPEKLYETLAGLIR